MDFSKLNKDQLEAVQSLEGPLLIIAGAGSGKTHTLVNRVANLIEHNVTPESILLLTFTNKAADEMKARAIGMSDERCGKIVACTYHSFCARMLRTYAPYVGFSTSFNILAPSECAEAIGFVKAQAGDTYRKLRGFPNNKTIAGIISGAINKSVSIRDYMSMTDSKYTHYAVEIQEIARKYAQYKRERNLMNYDDLLVYYVELLANHEAVRQSIERSFQYMMVDEYQDTNKLQEQIVLLMRQNNRNIAVVGDDAQSIYAFRGAEIDNILSFKDKFPGCKIVSLKTNYRSNDEIVQFANHVFNENKRVGFEKHMQGTYEAGYEPEIKSPDNQLMEAYDVIQYIQKKRQNGEPYKDVAVIARASSSFYQLETLLMQNHIPYVKYGGLKFLEHECVIDVLSYIRCVVNPADQLAWFRLLRLHPSIGETYSSRLAEECVNNREFLLTSKSIKKSFQAETNLLQGAYDGFCKKSFQDMIGDIVKFYTKLRKRCIEQARVADEANRTDMQNALEADEEVLKMLQQIIKEYPDANSFLDAITLDAISPNSKEEDSVVLTTIHSAKGLEFDTVFVLDCIEEVFPRANGRMDELEEELRCFYVAITRPKKHLFICCPRMVMQNGRSVYGLPSRWIEDYAFKKPSRRGYDYGYNYEDENQDNGVWVEEIF